jgi:hypothetical protein
MRYYKDTEIEGLEFNILDTLVELGLVSLQERPIVSSFYEQYLTVLDLLEDAAKAFMNYCDAQSKEYTAVRNAWKGSEEGRKILDAAFQKESKNYDLVAAPAKPSRITPQRQNRIDLGIGYITNDEQYKEYNYPEWQKEMVLDGKASFINSQFVWNEDREEPTQHVMSDEDLNKLLETPLQPAESHAEASELNVGTSDGAPVFVASTNPTEHFKNLRIYAEQAREYQMAHIADGIEW